MNSRYAFALTNFDCIPRSRRRDDTGVALDATGKTSSAENFVNEEYPILPTIWPVSSESIFAQEMQTVPQFEIRRQT